jgi:hypothetical protein
MDKVIKEYVKKHRVRNPINVTLTQKQFWKGVPIDDIQSERNFRHFQNVLNRKVFGNSYQRYGRKLQSLVVREVSGGGRHHLHLILETPQKIPPNIFVWMIRESWVSTNYGYDHIHMEIPQTSQREDGYLTYMMKGKTKPTGLPNSIDWMNSTCFEPL